jgi:RNA polymerase sigma-70 factor, ECF subfamily
MEAGGEKKLQIVEEIADVAQLYGENPIVHPAMDANNAEICSGVNVERPKLESGIRPALQVVASEEVAGEEVAGSPVARSAVQQPAMQQSAVLGSADGQDDTQLLRRAAGGDGRAFHKLVDTHSQRLFAIAVRLVGNSADAEDVLQETWAGAYRGMGRFEARASVKTWLTRILVVQAARWRREKRRRVMQPLDSMSVGSESDGGPAGVEKRMDLQAALLRLSPEHREVLVLREFEQMSYEEMAAVLDVPRGTVESRLHRARAELRDKLKDYRV